MATNNSPETFNLWKEFIESTAGESLENFVEGQVKLHGSKPGDIVHGVLTKYGRFLKNKTVLLLVGNALAAGLVKVLGVRNPDAARVLYAAVRHLAGGATEGAAETLKAAKDDASWDKAVKDAIHVSMADPAGLPKIPGGALSVYTHPEVAYGHRYDPVTGLTFCDVLGFQHKKHLAAHAGRTKVVKIPALDGNGLAIVDKNGRPTLTDQTVPDPVAFAAIRHDLFDFVKGADNRLCPSCFPHGAPEKPAEKKEDAEPKGRKEKYGTEVMNVITAAKNRLAKRGRDLPFAIDQLQDWPSVDADSLKATCAVLHGRIVDAQFHPETGALLDGELTDADLDRLILDIPVDGKENLTTVSKLRQLRDGAKQLLGYAPKEDDLPLLEKYSFKLVDFLRATEKLCKMEGSDRKKYLKDVLDAELQKLKECRTAIRKEIWRAHFVKSADASKIPGLKDDLRRVESTIVSVGKMAKGDISHLNEVLKVPDLKHLESVAEANWTPRFHASQDFNDAETNAFESWNTAVHMLVKGHEYDQERKNPTLHKAKPFILRTVARAAFLSKLLFVLFVIGWSAAGLRAGGSFDTSAIGLYAALGSGLALTLIVIAGLLPVELIAAIGDVLFKDKNRIDDTVKSVRHTLMITLGLLTIAVIPANLAQMPAGWYFPLFVLLLMASMAGTAALEKALAFETLRRSRHMLGLVLGAVVIVTLASLTVQALRKLHPDAAAAIEAKAAELTKKDAIVSANAGTTTDSSASGDKQSELNAKAKADMQNGGAAAQPTDKSAEAAGKPKSKAELERLLKLVEDYKKATAEKNKLQNQITKLENDAGAETNPQKLQQIEDAQKVLLDKQKTAMDEETKLRTQLEEIPEFRGLGEVAFEKKLRDELKALQGASKPSAPPVAKENGAKAKEEDKPQVASSTSLSVEAYCKGLPNKFRVGKCEKYKG